MLNRQLDPAREQKDYNREYHYLGCKRGWGDSFLNQPAIIIIGNAAEYLKSQTHFFGKISGQHETI